MPKENTPANIELSNRERQTLIMAADGLTDKEIANELGVTGTTVRTYWNRMRAKLNTVNRAQTIAKALRYMFAASQAELTDKNEQYRILIDTLVDFSVFILDNQRILQTWNPGVERLFGFTEKEWLGETADIIFTPEDRLNRVPEAEMAKAAADNRAEDERWHVRKDQTRFWASGVMIPMKVNDRVTGFAKIVRDGTRIKQLEAKIEELGGSIAHLPKIAQSERTNIK